MGEAPAPRPPSTPQAPEPTIPPQPPGEGLAVGLTETNAGLLANPRLAVARARRRRLARPAHRAAPALLPPDGRLGRPAARSGAAGESRRSRATAARAATRRACRPAASATSCAASAMQQQAAGGFDVFVVIYGVPDWAAQPANGCERPDAAPRSRPIADAAMPAYRAADPRDRRPSARPRRSRSAGGRPGTRPTGRSSSAPSARRATPRRRCSRPPSTRSSRARCARSSRRSPASRT